MANWTPTPTSGSISASQINQMLGRSSTSTFSLASADRSGSYHHYVNAGGGNTTGDIRWRVLERQNATGIDGGGTITTSYPSVYVEFNYANTGQRVAYGNVTTGGPHNNTTSLIITTYYTNFSGTRDSSKEGSWYFHRGAYVTTSAYSNWFNIDTNSDKVADASYRTRYAYYRVMIRQSSTGLPEAPGSAISFSNFYSMG